MTLHDTHGRRFAYLRVSVTPRCNFRCVYCMPADGVQLPAKDNLLSLDEIARVVRVAADIGFSKVRLTGGEPLARPGVTDLVRDIAATAGIGEVTMTTNASLLPRHAEPLKRAGLSRVNISLDSLHRDTAATLARRDVLPSVLAGIDAAIAARLGPIKLNCVVLPGVNDGELGDLVRYAAERDLEIRFIEYMPMGLARLDAANRTVTATRMRECLANDGIELARVRRGHAADPAEAWEDRATGARVGFITSMSQHFCDACDRMRLTAEGELRPCLHQDAGVSVRGLLRDGGSDADLRQRFADAASLKWAGHAMNNLVPLHVSRDMVTIGG